MTTRANAMQGRSSGRRQRLCLPTAVLCTVVAVLGCFYVYQNLIIKSGPYQRETTVTASVFHAGYIGSPPVRDQAATRKQPHVPRVLIWTQIHNKWDFGPADGNFTNFECSACRKACLTTNDRRTLNDSDAVLFHGKDVNLRDMPKWRSPKQIWVYWSMEPPTYPYANSLKYLHSTFNWSMTYRLDSDVVTYYGRVKKYKTPPPYDWEKLEIAWRQKSRMAVWLVSNCVTPGKRENYALELGKHVAVDVYGSCGSNKCPKSASALCYRDFSKQYFFYLSFENSICKDYVTEKLFKALRYDIIPVVFGGGNYSVVAPPGSYIDALSFSSPKHLAHHMKKVSSNFSLYAKYFAWKRTHSVTINNWRTQSYCSLCEKLQRASFKQQTVSVDPFHWWVIKSECQEWNK
ncbi:alpha-(1,3)-fucosyltransferase C-like isoform X3 [Haemaphysalis longicornis]